MRNLWITAMLCALLLSTFHLWYTAGGVLTSAEAEEFAARIESAARAGRIGDDERVRLLAFVRSDDGEPFVMVNLLRRYERARFRDGDRGMTGEEADSVYGRAVMPELLRRASHPLLVAWPVARLTEKAGAGPELDFIGAVRYRSRRDLLEMATSDRWGEIAEYKFAGLEYNALRPSELALSVSDPRLLLAVAILVILAGLRFFRSGRRSGLVAGLLVVPLLGFSGWYGTESALTPGEVERFIARLDARPLDPGAVQAMRRFAEDDDGRPFYNINLNHFRPRPVYPDGRETTLTSRETNALYTGVAGSTVLRNAGHPTLSVHPVAKLGPDGADFTWDDLNFIRYRSRRVLLEMLSTDAWDDAAVHKWAALESAVTYPSPGFHVPDPRIVLLGLSALALLLVPAGPGRTAGLRGASRRRTKEA